MLLLNLTTALIPSKLSTSLYLDILVVFIELERYLEGILQKYQLTSYFI